MIGELISLDAYLIISCCEPVITSCESAKTSFKPLNMSSTSLNLL